MDKSDKQEYYKPYDIKSNDIVIIVCMVVATVLLAVLLANLTVS